VQRNRVKRRLRARMAGLLPTVPPGVDLVIRAQPAAADAASAVLAGEVERLLDVVLNRVQPKVR